MDKIKKLYSNDYVKVAIYVIFLVGIFALYYFSHLFWTVAMVFYGILIIAFIISGNFKLAWDYIKYLLLGLLIGVILAIAHIAIFPWGIPFFIIGVFALSIVEADREPDEYLLKYITEMRTLGLSDNEITLNLQKANWKTKKILVAFKYLSKVYEHKKTDN